MTREILTADQWPGAPRFLPPLLINMDRIAAYHRASLEDAEVEDMRIAFNDLGQRLAKAEGRQK